MNQPKILVTGATGRTGAALVAELRKREWPVRAMVSREDARSAGLQKLGAEIVVADMYDPQQLFDAIKGTQRAYYLPLMRPYMIQAATAFVVAAREAKPESIVQMSQWTSSASHPTVMTRQTWLVDRLFSMIPGVAHIIFNPGMFADNFLRVIDFAALLGIFPVLMGDSKCAPISNEDMARCAAALLMDDPANHAGKSYRPTGTELLSGKDMAGIIAKAVGHSVFPVNLPLWLFRKVARMQKIDPFQIYALLKYVEDNKQGAFSYEGGVTQVMQKLTGSPAENFETTARRYAAMPFAQQTVANRLKAFVNFNITPFYPGYNIAAYERKLEIPIPPHPCNVWKMRTGRNYMRRRWTCKVQCHLPPESLRPNRNFNWPERAQSKRTSGETNMKSPLYLVTGATGVTGGHAINSLLSADASIRAFVPREDERSEALNQRGVELFVGDINDFRAVQKALAGVTGAYFCYPISEGIVKATAQFAQAAKEQEVGIIVNMSQAIAREDARSNASLQHWIAERVFDWSGVPVTHIRPTFFLEWLFYMAPMIHAGTIYAPYGSGKTAFISGEDQGRVIAAILQEPEPHIGKVYPLFGPTECTFAETTEVIGKTLGRTITYQQVPFQMMIEGIEARSGGLKRNNSMNGYAETSQRYPSGESFLAQHLREAVEDHHAGLFAGTNHLVQQITGRTPLSIEEFVSKHRAVFEATPALAA